MKEGITIQESDGMTNVWEALKQKKGGVVLFDLDGPLKNGEAVRNKRPGYVPDECLENLELLMANGVSVAIVSNQPSLVPVAGISSKIIGYDAFPGCFTKRGIPFFGSGWNWPNPKKRRKSEGNVEALIEVADWVVNKQSSSYQQTNGMDMNFVSDRSVDETFFRRLVDECLSRGVNVSRAAFYKIPGGFDGLDRSPSRVLSVLSKAIP